MGLSPILDTIYHLEQLNVSVLLAFKADRTTIATPVVTTMLLLPFTLYLLFLQAHVVAIQATTTTNLGRSTPQES